MSRLLLLGCLLLMGPSALAVEPATVTLPPGSYSVADVLLHLDKQTGNRVIDRRTATNAKLDIAFSGQTFWQALDRLAEKADARIAYYGEGGIALVDGPRRAGTVADTGICRVEIKNIIVQRDVETNRRTCAVELEIVWEPRYEPFFLTVDKIKGKFAADADGKELSFGPIQGVAQPVTQRRAQIVDVRFPGPERSSPAIATLSGELKLVIPERMLTATFLGAAAGKLAFKDGVTVELRSVKPKTQGWTVDIDIENPPGGPKLESFQAATWIENNRIHFERMQKGVKEIWSPRPDDWNGDVTERRAKLQHFFAGAKDKGNPADWTLVYRTPGRIVEVSLPFEFRNVALP